MVRRLLWPLCFLLLYHGGHSASNHHPTTAPLVFESYRSAEQPKCGAFLLEHKDDVVLGTFYSTINRFVAIISRPFPHQDLLNKAALTGDLTAVRESFIKKHVAWFDSFQWWIVITASLVFSAVLFPLLYLLYRCCKWCCRSGKNDSIRSTDSERDGCRRTVLNGLIAVLVVAYLFFAVTLLVTGQYAEYGLDELPNRLNHCIDDLALYKRDTDMAIRKLLIDDYGALNASLVAQMDSGGRTITQRLKQITGAAALDVFQNIYETAASVQSLVSAVNAELDSLNEEIRRLKVELSRLRKTEEPDLVNCIENEVDPWKALCHEAQRLLDAIERIPTEIRPVFMTEENEAGLQRLLASNMTILLSEASSQFQGVENAVQREIDAKKFSAQNELKKIGDDLFLVAETISSKIRQINFDTLYEVITRYWDPSGGMRRYIQWSWYASLAVTSLVVLLSLLWLLGALYGVCGRRRTYYSDDCCVRSTGAKFYSCALTLSLLTLVPLTLLALAIMLVSGNATWLVCQPLEDPLQRPDMLSLVERYASIVREQRRRPISAIGTPSAGGDNWLDMLTPTDMVRACYRNETFYQMLDLDKVYHLSNIKIYSKESYDRLDNYLRLILAEVPVDHPFVNLVSQDSIAALERLAEVNFTRISEQATERVKEAMDELDLASKMSAFADEIARSSAGTPRSVDALLERVRQVDEQLSRPLRRRLGVLHGNLTQLDGMLGQLRVPVRSLIVKMQHAQQLLTSNFSAHFEQGARDALDQMMGTVDVFVRHVQDELRGSVSSCMPVMKIARDTRSALCQHTVAPFNGAWASLLACVLLSFPLICLSTCLSPLYRNMHKYPKLMSNFSFIQNEPPPSAGNYHHHHSAMARVSAFATDTYDVRNKNAIYSSNYPYQQQNGLHHAHDYPYRAQL